MSQKPFKIFYVTDIHGSEICWRKFLNAGTFYQADVVSGGGDITGKAMVPIIRRRDRWDTTMFDQHIVLKTEAEVDDIERKIRNRGYYPVRMSDDDYDQLQADPEEVARRFTQVILQETQRWIEMADDKLRGKVHRVIVCPADDDMFELDPLLQQQGHVLETNDRDPLDLDGFQMISLGWTNPTPWNTFRELPENELAKRVDELVAKVIDPSRTIFNFHAPPYRSGLDEAPVLDENLNMKAGGRAMQPVGSTCVRTAIERVQPLLGCMAIFTKAGERYESAGRWHSTQGAATKRACCRARSSHSTRKSQDKKLRAGQRIGPPAAAATARTAREGAAA